MQMKVSLPVVFLAILFWSGCKGDFIKGQVDPLTDPGVKEAVITYTGPVDFRFAAKVTTPCVVNIKATYGETGAKGEELYEDIPEFFREFFRHFEFPQNTPRPRQSSGSGVILSEDGHIVTNHHVIRDADEIEVTLYDRTAFKGTVVGIDSLTDLALLKIEAKDLLYLDFGNSDSLEVGEWVVAVGNPFNLASTVTAGIVSAKARNINIMREQGAIESFIQTDAAVNPGNSGGALVRLDGKLVGINTAIATPTGVYAGYAFAIPSEIVKKVVEDLTEYGVVQRGVLGVIIRDLDSETANNLKVGRSTGVVVDSMLPNSAAREAGLRRNDVIVRIDQLSIHSAPELQEYIARKRPGDRLLLTVIRNGKPVELAATLQRAAAGRREGVKSEQEILKVLGVELSELNEADLHKYQVEGGVKVVRIHPGKLKSQTGIREGLVIMGVNKKPVNSIDAFLKEMENQKGGVMLAGKYPGDNKVYYFAFGME